MEISKEDSLSLDSNSAVDTKKIPYPQVSISSEISPSTPVLVKEDHIPKLYFNLEQAAHIAGCKKNELLHYAGLGRLRIHVPVPPGIQIHSREIVAKRGGIGNWNIELLGLRPRDCRAIEMHGAASAKIFPVAWEINGEGRPKKRIANEFKDDGYLPHGMWACFKDGEPAEIECTADRLFVFAFDLKEFLDGTYRASDEEEENSPKIGLAGHEYESEMLVLLRRAAKKFWAPVKPTDRTSFPSVDEVADWLGRNDMRNNLCKPAAAILRPEFAMTKGVQKIISTKKNKTSTGRASKKTLSES